MASLISIVLEVALSCFCKGNLRSRQYGTYTDEPLYLQPTQSRANLGYFESAPLCKVLFCAEIIVLGSIKCPEDFNLVRVEALGELRHLAHRRALREDAAALL